MKNIAAVGVLERIRRLAPQGPVPPYRTVEEWREWQLAEGRKR
ncbi:DNA replication protein DnaC, partial [Escherichia coli]|nr:DNA replication protein [Escherichia coli]